METFTETETKILSAIRTAVCEKGRDYVYDTIEAVGVVNTQGEWPLMCSYLDYTGERDDQGCPTQPSCIIGQGLLKSDSINRDALFDMEGESAYNIMYMVRGDDVSDTFARAMSMMQATQDNFHSWGTAYDQGLAELADAGYDTTEFTV